MIERKIRILVVDDHDCVAEGFCSILAREHDLEVVGRALDGQTAIRRTRELQPDVVLMDLNLPGIDGVDATRAIIAAHPTIRVVFLTMFDDPIHVREARSVGAAGFLSKGMNSETLIRAIRTVYTGSTVFPQKNPRQQADAGREPLDLLSPRELQVLRLMARHMDQKKVKAVLQMEAVTVRTHINNIVRKLGFANRINAIVWYRERYLLKQRRNSRKTNDH